MRVEVLSRVERQRQWSDDEKAQIVEETLVLGTRVAEVARRNAVSASLVFGWPRLVRDGRVVRGGPSLVPVEIVAPAPVLAAASRPAPSRSKRSGGLIEIELLEGHRLRVGADVDGDALRRVLDALEAPRLVSATARRHGITRSQLMAWRRALKVERVAPEPAPASAPAILVPEPAAKSEPAPRRRKPRQAAQCRIVIEVGRGRRVVVDGAVDAEALARVLAVLDRR